MKNEQSQPAAPRAAASFVDRTNTQAQVSLNQSSSFARDRKSISSAGKKAASLPASIVNNYARDPVAYLKDPPEKKKRQKSPRQVQIEFIDNEQAEELRKEATAEKQSRRVDDVSMIAKKAETAHSRGDLLTERDLLEEWAGSRQPAS